MNPPVSNPDLTTLGEAPLRAFIDRNPHHVEALDLLGHWLSRNGKPNEGAEFICRAYVLQPPESQPPRMRGIAFYILGRIDEAAEVYKSWLAREPGNDMARHLYASCSGTDTPVRASDGFIRATFDDYAPIFDERLRQLGYRVPQEMVQWVDNIAPPAAQWDILDAGCGTGGLGPLIRPWAKTLIGVDISAGMLAQARQRGCYDELVESELCGYLGNLNSLAHRADGGHFDLIALADTLIYFGDLMPVVQRAATVCRRGGWLLFNIELATVKPPKDRADKQCATPYHLVPSGRYQHQRDHVDTCLRGAGFTPLRFSEIDIRAELGVVIKGALVLAQMKDLA
jgi:predicted TPR repeat methyltransferase